MSLEFTPYDEAAIEISRPYFDKQESRLCDYTTGTSYMWRHAYQEEYAVSHGCLLTKATMEDGSVYFGVPIGDGDKEDALSALEEYCHNVNIPLRFCTVPAGAAQYLAERYGAGTKIVADLDAFDYLYNYADLATFAGRRYSAQRNHINQFVKKWPDWQYHVLEPEMVPEIVAFLKDLVQRKEQGESLSPTERADINGTIDLLNVMHRHSFVGGYITVGNAVAAFSIGEVVGDTLYVHVEKGDTRYSGVYQLMVREFAAHNQAEGVRYINREDAAGDEGLRRSKMAYRPCTLLEKYIVIPSAKSQL